MDTNATYLYRDQAGSVVMSTLASFTVQQRQYFPYGKKRGGDDFTFEADYTGQRRDDTGLMYYNARYYDPQLGMFISPDTIIPDPTDYFSYNRYLYARGNSMLLNDPTGHCPWCLPLQQVAQAAGQYCSTTTVCQSAIQQTTQWGNQISAWAIQYGTQAGQVAQTWGDKLPGIVDMFSNSSNIGTPSMPNGFGQFDPGGFNFDPNQFDPNKFSKQDIGKAAHRQFRQEFRTQMTNAGRQEKAGDFLTEKAIRDANGNTVYNSLGQLGKPDAVDYQNHIIYDLKPWQLGGVEVVAREYATQFQMYKNLYQQAYGVVPQVTIILYGAPAP